MKLKNLVWASILAALSIVIDILFKFIVPANTMGTPYYAIPIIVAAIFLGPKYSIAIAFMGDLVSTVFAGDPYYIFFSLGSVMWGIIPGLLLRNRKKFSSILLVILLTHLVVTSVNSFALAYHFHKSFKVMLIGLPLRAALIIPNSLVISLLVTAVLEPIKLRKELIN